jgi:hypothetical protein
VQHSRERGEFNLAANLADCFRLQTAIATATMASLEQVKAFATSGSARIQREPVVKPGNVVNFQQPAAVVFQ